MPRAAHGSAHAARRGPGRPAPALLAALLLVATPAAADTIVLTDAEGDAHGPGTYRYPGPPLLPEGALDLDQVILEDHGDTIDIEVRLHRRIRTSTVRLSQDEPRTVFAPQIDLYIDQDRLPGSGATAAVPGRQVGFPDGFGWERLVVLTATPERVSSSLDGRLELGPALVPHDVRVRGRSLFARVRTADLGGAPSPDWSYAVAVTSATFSSSIAAVVDPTSDAARNAYTREVTPVVGTCANWEEEVDGSPCTFGGCAPCGGHPRVLDALDAPDLPSPVALADYASAEGRLARLPVVTPSGKPAPAPPQGGTAPPSQAGTPTTAPLQVIDIDGDLITSPAPPPGEGIAVAPGRIVDILDARSSPVGKAVIVKVLDGLLVLRIVRSPASADAIKAVRLR